jgi:hypothetical protein
MQENRGLWGGREWGGWEGRHTNRKQFARAAENITVRIRGTPIFLGQR